ncbi:2-oxoadipate dioxygenase/decarboxylase family protein, partial [Escherichia coli]
PECGITPKTLIEGPPRREVPILLRQTSFKALEEQVLFVDEKQGTHTARFGEIEQRGVALTPKGRRLYDELLHKAGTGKDNFTHQLHLR